MPSTWRRLLVWQIQTNEGCGFSESIRRDLNSRSALRVFAWIVRSTPPTTSAIKNCELRRPHAPFTSLLPRHHMEVEVRCFLPAEDPVVLKGKYSEGPKCLDERRCNSLCRDCYGLALVVRKIE